MADIYKTFSKMVDTGHMDVVRESIENQAGELARQEEELRKSPVYKYPADYARENGDLDQYRLSNKANIACTRQIDAAISKHHDGFSFDSKAALQGVVKKFGYERTLFVLAATARNGEHDGRYSRANKDWARTVPVFDTERSVQYSLRSHPVLADAFVSTARHEYLLSLPLTKEDIKVEALNILCKFQDARVPNSPNGTHYMAQISPDFLARAKTKDTDRLMAMLPFQSLSFSTLEGRKGTFALISQDENRFQKIQLRKDYLMAQKIWRTEYGFIFHPHHRIISHGFHRDLTPIFHHPSKLSLSQIRRVFLMFLGLAWYWWLVIVVLVILSIPFKVKFMKWWSKRQQEQNKNRRRKWGEDE